MASSVQWSNLNPDILTIISKILNVDVDNLRLRSVCSSWRSSIPRRVRPSPFPLEVPPLSSHGGAPLRPGRHYLDYTTLYRLSPLKHGPHVGDPSEGWLIRVLELNPNHFLLTDPLLSSMPEYTPDNIPKHLNLLNHRITEVSKSYNLNIYDVNGCGTYMNSVVKKVFILEKYVVGCDFAVILLRSDQLLSYWKFGDKAWTPIDTKDYDVTDVVLCNGKCYAIGRKGVLVWFDSKLNLTAVPLPPLPVNCVVTENYLVEYKSDLYAVSRILEHTISSDEDEGSNETSFKLKVFKKCNDRWKRIRCLGNVILLSSNDVSFGLSTEVFRGKRGNCVYMAHMDYIAIGFHYGVYHLDEGKASALKLVRDWPPPLWAQKIAIDS